MEPVAVAPVFVAEGPMLRWLDTVFLTLAARVHIPATALTGDFPPVTATPLLLRAELERRREDKEPTDDLWTAIAALARHPGEPGQTWQTLACGLAIKALRQADRRLRAGHVTERCDIHSDLVEGFLTRLTKIDTAAANIQDRLIDAAKRHAEKQRKARLTDLPAEFDWLPHPTATPGSGPHNWTEALQNIADDFAAAGRSLDPLGLELIARTLVDYEELPQAAANLGLSTEAAYKRRQRAEDRIAAFYRITVKRPASGRPVAVSRGATADVA